MKPDFKFKFGGPKKLTSVLSLALDGTGAGSEVAAFDESLGRGKVAVDQGSEVGRAFATAVSVLGTEVAAGDLRRGLAVARSYTRRG